MIFLFGVIDMRFYILPIFSLILLCGANSSIAQSFIPTAVDGLTEVTPVGNNRWDITTKNPPSSSINQFHSFTNFNVGAGEIVRFVPNGMDVKNILSRVTGGTPSQIQGMIQASGGVNLFLMNPAGILFGNGARLDVPGSFTATTANAIGFGNNNWFNATGNNNYTNLTGIPNQFAFTNANPGAIVNTGNLTLKDGKSLNLIGGTVINTGTIATPGGNVTIAAVEGGKAVQITAPGSLLSYIVPIASGVNPAIGNPVSLPELLAGSPLDSANGIELNKDGVVTLVRSQTPLPDRSGLAIVGGNVNTSIGSTNGTLAGNVKFSGKTIVVTNPDIQSESISLIASDRITFEDLGGDKLELGQKDGQNMVGNTSVLMQTTSDNGIIESLNPKDEIKLSSGALSINSGSVKLGDLTSSSSVNDTGIKISTTNDINIGDLISNRLVELISRRGNIRTKNISNSGGFFPTTKLTADIGSIEINSIEAGVFASASEELTLDVFAGGTFRVVGTIGNKYSYRLRDADDSLLQFLQEKTGIDRAKLKQDSSMLDVITIPTPISIDILGGGVRIRHSGATGPENKPLKGVIIQGGKSRFEIGPKGIPQSGDRYVPEDPFDSFAQFSIQAFPIRENTRYTPIVIPQGTSGTVGAIVRRVKGDGTLTIGVQDRAFGVVPIVPIEPKPIDPIIQKPNTPNISTIDLENRPTSQLTACPDKKTIVLTPPEAIADRKEPTKSIKKNPCISNNDDDEILKILK